MFRTRLFLAAPILAALAFSAAAEAHPRLVSSTPAANASVAQPGRIELKFSETLIGAMTGADVVMTGMPGMANHRPMKMSGLTSAIGRDGKTLTLSPRRALTTGTYRVTWHAVSTDTHRIAGNYSFTVR
jgi:methionine-rich copper-binding protein CopC